MQNSGTKLVLAMVGLAIVLGMISWWYRYEAAHRASQFWGPEASRLIAESEGFEVIGVKASGVEESDSTKDLSHARGQAHLRHALMSDGNYLWNKKLEEDAIDWRWTLRFHQEEQEVLILLSDDLQVIGKPGEQGSEAYACTPMASSIKTYFEEIGLLESSRPSATE